jgi:quercetin dioxygenase-like cupin family protein
MAEITRIGSPDCDPARVRPFPGRIVLIAILEAAHCAPPARRCIMLSATRPLLAPAFPGRPLAIAAVAGPLVIASAMAQQPAIKRTPLQTVDFPAGYNVVTAIAEVPAGSCAGRHTHPGVESSYVMEGPMVVKIEGKPDQTFKTDDSFQIPVNAVHDALAPKRRGLHRRTATRAPAQHQCVFCFFPLWKTRFDDGRPAL